MLEQHVEKIVEVQQVEPIVEEPQVHGALSVKAAFDRAVILVVQAEQMLEQRRAEFAACARAERLVSCGP